MASKIIGGISVTISAVTSPLERGLKSARKSLGSFVGGMKSAALSAKGLGVALAGAGFSTLVKQQFDAVDAMAKTADKLGVTTEALAGLQHAADLAGASNGVLESSMLRMQKTITDGAAGIGTSAEALASLGLSAQSLVGMTADQQLATIADGMRGLGSAAERTTVAMKLFGKGGTALIPTLLGGSKGFADARAEAELLGKTISRIDAAKIEMANDSVTKMRGAFTGVTRQVAIGLSPAIVGLAESTTAWLTSFNIGNGKVVGGIEAVGKSLGVVADVVSVLKMGFMKLQQFVLESFASIVSGANSAQKSIVAVVNKIPGVEVQASTFLDALSDEMSKSAVDAKARFDAAWIAPPPSQGINRFFDDVTKRAEESAAAIQALNSPQAASMKKFLGLKDSLSVAGQSAVGSAKSMLASSLGLMRELIPSIPKVGSASNGVRSPSSTLSSSISAQAPDSREGFAQRVRSLAQNNLAKLGQQQLATQKQIAAGINKLANSGTTLVPLNLA
jgi:hypothetical protein